MPNTPRGGGVSRKIANITDRKRLKKVVDELDVPTGMAVIVRTAGSKRTKTEIKRDYSNSTSIWENVKNLTLESNAPFLIHEEGSLVKRAIRDLYHSDINEVLVDGNEAYKTCKNYMKSLMPSHAKKVQQYNDDKNPLFQKYKVDSQLHDIFNPKVTLKSGGYLIIDQTEALVAVDVNSGKATRERSIEDTALKTNLEAAEEFARQARLRDLSGLIVIDFIDMEENKNRINVEKKLKETMRKDRARIQIGEISNFGLLELSRQRLRPSIVENSSELCPHCGGSGRIQSIEVSAIQILRSIEEECSSEENMAISVSAHSDIIIHILNNKRSHLNEIEIRYGISINFINDNTIIPPLKKLEVIKKNNFKQNNSTENKQDTSSSDNDEKQIRKKRSKRPVKKRRKEENKTKIDNSSNSTDEDKNDKVKETALDENKELEPDKDNTKKIDAKQKNTKKKIIRRSKTKTDTKIKNEKDKLGKTAEDRIDLRKTQSSAPIEIMKVDGKLNSDKTKKKGWWST